MTTQQLLDLSLRELTKMTDRELKQAVSTLRSTARKRYERLVNSGEVVNSPAAIYLQRGGLYPTIKGMDTVTLRNEFKRYKHFLGLKTSTVSGTKKYYKDMKEMLQATTGDDTFNDDESLVEFWKLYDSAKNTDVGAVLNYRQVMNEVAEIYDNNSDLPTEELLQKIRERLQTVYENENTPQNVPVSARF